MEWPNVSELVRTWIAAQVPALAGQVWTRTPPTAETPRAVLARVGGTIRDVDRDVDLEITLITDSDDALSDLSYEIDEAMLALAAKGNEWGYVDDVYVRFAWGVDETRNREAGKVSSVFAVTVRRQPPRTP